MGVLALAQQSRQGTRERTGRKEHDSGRGSACERRAVLAGGCRCACEDQWFEETATEAEKQIHALNDLLKENNGSLVVHRLAGQAVHAGQRGGGEPQEVFKEGLHAEVGQSRAEEHGAQLTLSKAETLRQEWKEHKECADELERNVEEIHRFAQTE